MLILNAEIAGQLRSVRVANGRIETIHKALARQQGEAVLDARGGALIPGLTDHHLHLQSLAAALASVPCGPPTVETADALARMLADADPKDGWLRGTGYFESVAGDLDRDRLDLIRSDVPLRIQHRSGALWILNSLALGKLNLESGPSPSCYRESQGQRLGHP